ncbi:hypothetical protein HRK28_08875 [Rathayibacter sp. VKM Ac-2835]|uniref:DUF4286 family protein n=1 Tax=Rathayibacter sp. VKM Ac-2835 TaxID=2739043 RepID=UPI001564A7B7|nr:DUF4286 family protein [Rathayibacter sp. VKM Ac-2835]NRG41036.1 hypothetical protein [Rathayibacter sp. VKM Ac-2835]
MSDSPQHEIILGFAEPVEGREAEFEEWYSTVHIPELLQLPGFVSAQRYEVLTADPASGPGRFVTAYTIEGSAVEARNAVFGATLTATTAMDTTVTILAPLRPLGAPHSAS